MKRTTNTANEPRIDWLFGMNPRAIENQEAEGQKELVNSEQLPAKLNGYRNESPIEQYKKMGIEVIGQSEGDELFLDVKLPDGWKKEATDHSMWNKLVDDKGRQRAMFFYKAAFYDRDAFINFETRYQKGCDYFDNEKNPAKDWDKARQVYVKDANTGEKIWTGEKHFYDGQDKAYKDAENWLNERYPNWQDINAYWD